MAAFSPDGAVVREVAQRGDGRRHRPEGTTSNSESVGGSRPSTGVLRQSGAYLLGRMGLSSSSSAPWIPWHSSGGMSVP